MLTFGICLHQDVVLTHHFLLSLLCCYAFALKSQDVNYTFGYLHRSASDMRQQKDET